MKPEHTPGDLEEALTDLPDRVADSQRDWRIATLERERVEAKLFLRYRMGDEKRTADEAKALMKKDDERYEAVLNEARKEADYTRLYERLLSFKKLADHRTAF